jgi:hypothetical protein
MARAAFQKTSFNGGELSPLLDGRADLGKYANGCTVLENFLPTVQGPVYRRPGTRFVDDLGSSDPVLVPFIYNREQTYILAIGSVIRLYTGEGVVESSPGVPYTFGAGVWSAPPRRADGRSRLSYTQSGDILFVCDADGGKPLMAIKRLGALSWTVEPYTLANPPLEDWNTATCLLYSQLADGTTAAADEFYLAVNVGKVAGQMLANGTGGWTGRATSLAANAVADSPLYSDRRGKIAIDFASHVAEPVRWDPSSGSPVFTAFGGTIDFQAAGWYYNYMVASAGRVHLTQLQVDGILSSEVNNEYNRDKYIGNGAVVFEILESGIADKYRLTSGTEYDIICARVRLADGPENEWREPAQFKNMGNIGIAWDSLSGNRASTSYKVGRWAWASVRDYAIASGDESLQHAGVAPDSVALFRERLWLGSARDIWASQAGGFNNFNDRDGAGLVAADSALALTLLAGDLAPVSWMAPSGRLILGSAGGERAIGEQNISNAFGPQNVKVDVTAATGSVDVVPALVGNDILFLDRTGRRLYRSTLGEGGQAFQNLSALADHIGLASPFVAMAWREIPTPVLFLASQAGDLVGVTFDASQEVVAWSRHVLGGGGLVRDLGCIPSADGTRDNLWLLVEHTVLGVQRFYLEVMPDEYRMGMPIEDARFLDCSLVYDGVPADVISGLDHLEGETVQAVGDGFALGEFAVSVGSITLPQEYSKISVGLHAPSRLRTMRVHLGADDGVAMGKKIRIHKAAVRLVDTVNIQTGWAFDKLVRQDFREPGMAMDAAIPGQTVERVVSFPGTYDGDGYVCIQQDLPLPCTIVALAIEFEVN